MSCFHYCNIGECFRSMGISYDEIVALTHKRNR